MSITETPNIELDVDNSVTTRQELNEAVDDAVNYAHDLISETYPSFKDVVRMSVRTHGIDGKSNLDSKYFLANASVGVSFTSEGTFGASGSMKMESVRSFLNSDERKALIRESWDRFLAKRSESIKNYIRSLDEAGEVLTHG